MKSYLKIKTMNASEIASAVGGVKVSIGAGALGEVTNVCTGSNEAEKGSLFCAIKGARVDGHRFIGDAADHGAVCVLAEKIPDDLPSGVDIDIIKVDDTVAALGALAGYYRKLSKARCVAVTGSVGKTSTKEFVYAVLKEKYITSKSTGNHNNEIGMPMTLLDIGRDDEAVVLEMGMSALGEISFMSRLALPEIGIITNIGTAHLASLGSRENICRAKMEIADGIPNGGKLILNTDEPLLASKMGKLDGIETVGYSINGSAELGATNIRTNDTGTEFDLILSDRTVENIYIPTLGRHHVYNALAAAGAGYELGLTDDEIRAGLASFVNADMRQKIFDIEGVTVIEDCYNASPESMKASLDVLRDLASRRGACPAALLGDMLELGEDSLSMHAEVGRYAASVGVGKLFCYGKEAGAIAKAAIESGLDSGKVYVSDDSGDPVRMAEILEDVLAVGDVLLVKASRGIRAENVIEEYENRLKRERS